MLHLPTKVYFGNFHRFCAYQFDNARFTKEWLAAYGDQRESMVHTIFVVDAEQTDEYGLALVVFQENCENIESLGQVIAIVRKRYPEAFVDPYATDIFYAPWRDNETVE